MRLQNKPAPDLEELTEHDYEHMLTLSNNQRQKYYTYLFKTICSNKAGKVCEILRWELTQAAIDLM